MLASGESQKEVIRPDFNRAIRIDFQGTQISSDTGFILLREIDERFSIIDPTRDCLVDLRSPAHMKHAKLACPRRFGFTPGADRLASQIAVGHEGLACPKSGDD
jgi:hypothetical protein